MQTAFVTHKHTLGGAEEDGEVLLNTWR